MPRRHGLHQPHQIHCLQHRPPNSAPTPLSSPAMAANAAPTTWSLLDPEGIVVDSTTQYSRDTVWFEMRDKATLVLHMSLREVVDPYSGGQTIRLFPEVASTHKDKVLFLLRSPHGAIPTIYFVYSSQTGEVVRLPGVWPEVLSPESIGLLNSGEGDKYSYQVAHLSLKADQSTGLITHGFLHLWKYFPSSTTSPWTHENVRVSLASFNLKKWHTHRVISFDGIGLLWVDLQQGMLHLHPGEPARFNFIPLPKFLPDIRTNPWRHSRPELFRNVGCCNGRIKFVNLDSRHRRNNIVEVDIWTLSLDRNLNRYWTKDNTSLKLNCRNLWDNLRHTHNWLPPWPKSVPIFPILDMDKNNILYLTVAQLNNEAAWLLQIDIHNKTLKDVAVYTGYCSHMNPPFPSNLSKYQAPAQDILATSDPR